MNNTSFNIKFLLIFFSYFFYHSTNKLFSIGLVGLNEITKDAKSIVLLDYDTNRVLYSKLPNLVVPPASLTKLVTIYTALIEAEKRNIKFDSKVPISDSASYYNAPLNSSLMFLEKGQVVSFEELLKGLAVSSGNDASIAIAEFVTGGNLNSFINLMNINILNLGLLNMYFVEPSGYSNENKITALDMAFFSKFYIQKFGFMLSIHSLKDFVYPKRENLGVGKTTLSSKLLNLKQKNKNLLIYNYPYADGLKTGYIKESGLNLVATAKRDEIRLIAVVLGVAKRMNGEGETKRILIAKSLFEYGFKEYSKFSLMINLKKKVYNSVLGTVTVYSKEPFCYLLSKSEFNAIDIKYSINKLVAPLREGEFVGKAFFSLKNKKIGEVNLFSEKSEKLGFLQVIYRSFKKIFKRVLDLC